MSFYPQPNLWTCGPFALKHALATLGIFANEKDVSKLAGTNWWHGTDEIQLAKAAHRYDCTLKVFRRFNAEQARRELKKYLKRGIPCLLCVHEWQHWVTVVKEERGKFIILDSRDRAVLTILTWRQLRRQWVYHEQDEVDRRAVQTFYDFHPVEPKFRLRTRAKFSIARANYLRRPLNRTLSRHWEQYVNDLLELCKPRTALSERVFSLGTFLRRHEAMIVDQVDLWHGYIDRTQARRVLRHLHFVADTYGLVVHQEDEKRAIAGITAILTLWAAGRYGVSPVYGAKK
ncbi:MAG: hypothetical protein A3H45_08315 [Ignavibacteria bacterium RIFCSPLOWO2_02_FULL_55_14]|nr:MAG: hypothetical protein A2X68_04405 [Ignavibacteria bacterium GWC2_56_12]OGU64040.1 MAG: hypothetical protein A3C56_09945 [Ignavibacteria bacterium RIFCSPHIGHO2_02_FULL_56_12]OGU72323.1 MAG: hypothetical protein A3H45_08315 [Ignavibacteria bacterium RIFCSPLOWO2_02_FULL_55_14]OGU75223.1 MAG: hypothetical protein A3G43_05370 [Ignavibacteria bacterium RIFCSPLOWO2_12_FULL_56_21]HAV23341.1 hypothetical protein [Bacteroidota bacterium]